MNRFAILIVIALAVLAETGAVSAATLRASVFVNAASITVGDIFEGAGAAAKTIISPAPPPGKHMVFKARRLVNLARRHGLEWSPEYASPRVVVTRASRVVDAEEINQAVRDLLERQGMRSDRRVSLSNQALEVHVSTDRPDPYSIVNLRHNKVTGRFSGFIHIPHGAGNATRVRVTGKVFTMTQVPVLNRRISRGELIQRTDIEWTSVRSDKAPTGVILDSHEIIGKTPRRTIPAGRPLRNSDIRAPIAVVKGSLVTLILRTPKMILTAKVKAIQSGALGESIRLLNTRSNKIIDGVVVGPGQVSVPYIDLSSVTSRGY